MKLEINNIFQAIFGMNFFDIWGDSGSGLGGLKMSSYWWLYPATAVPLTAVVIVIWILWGRFRLERKSRRLPDIEAGRSVTSLGSAAYSGSVESVESVAEKEKVTRDSSRQGLGVTIEVL